jgi:hypothetical protein
VRTPPRACGPAKSEEDASSEEETDRNTSTDEVRS